MDNHVERTMHIDLKPAEGMSPSEGKGGNGKTPGGESRDWTSRIPDSAPFYTLFESIYDAALITTRMGKIMACNERAATFFRRSKSELVGSDVVSLISGATESLIRTVNKNLENDKYTLVEGICRRGDKTSFYSEIAVNKVDLDSAGELCFFVRDITIRAQAQNALKDAVERLQAHDRARMEFVSNVSHELRTPLTSMIYAINNMLRGVVGPIPDKAVHYLERLQSDSRRLLATVNDILDLRQIENKSLILTRAVIPLGPIILSAIETLQVQADAKAILLTSELPREVLFSLCDAQKMERVMLNILGNAIKFTPSQGKIVARLYRDSGDPETLCVSVCDTGMGIPREMLPKISRRYFRVGDHVTGSGLGLAISREIVELHGGKIRFESPVPGTTCGTAVYLNLPLAPKPHVVVYTESGETRGFLETKIGTRGYTLDFAGRDGRVDELCIREKPLGVILDRTSRSLDMREIILRLREDTRTKRLPILVLGEGEINRSEKELYLHVGVIYSPSPWSGEEIAHQLALAALGKFH